MQSDASGIPCKPDCPGPLTGILQRTCHLGGLLGIDRSLDGSSTPKRSWMAPHTARGKQYGPHVAEKSCFIVCLSLPHRTPPGQAQSCIWPRACTQHGNPELSLPKIIAWLSCEFDEPAFLTGLSGVPWYLIS